MKKVSIVKQKGIGLIELMISITLGLFLISGAIGVFLSSKISYGLNSELGWIQDNARFATTVLNKDIRMAGFFGCSTQQGFVSTLNPLSGTNWSLDFSNAVRGWDGDDGAYPTPEFPAPYTPAASVGGGPKSDLFTLRRADDVNVKVTTHDTASAVIGVVGTHTFEKGDILVITDCENTSVIQHTGNGTNKVNHNTGTGTPGNCSKSLGSPPCGSNDYEFRPEKGAFVAKVSSHAYFVGEASNGVPALYRRELVGSNGSATAVDEELVQGVENVQVLYGFDSNGSGVANRYLDADGLAFGDWANVVSVRLHLLFRSFVAVASEPQVYRFADATYTPTDRFLRQEVISTIALRN